VRHKERNTIVREYCVGFLKPHLIRKYPNPVPVSALNNRETCDEIDLALRAMVLRCERAVGVFIRVVFRIVLSRHGGIGTADRRPFVGAGGRASLGRARSEFSSRPSLRAPSD
jgi:hypothetical protein